MAEKRLFPLCKGSVASGLHCSHCNSLCHKSCATRRMDSSGVCQCCALPVSSATDMPMDVCVSVDVVAPFPATTTSQDAVSRAARANTTTNTVTRACTSTTTTTTTTTSAIAASSRMSATATNQGAVSRTSRSSRPTDTPQLLRSASLNAHSSRTADFDANRYSSFNIDLSMPSTFNIDKIADINSINSNTVQPPNGRTNISFQQLSEFFSAEFDRKNERILSRIDSLAAQMSVITERTEAITQLTSQVSNIETRVANLENIETRVSNLENANDGAAAAAALPQVNVNINDLASELQDRFFRARNLFIYGLPVDASNSQRDFQQVSQLLSAIPGISLNGMSVRRLPSTRQNGPGPVVARLPSQDEVIRVLRNRRLLPPAITPRADRTEAERAHLRSVSAEIEQHNAAHPDDQKKLVYVRGVPTAVPKKKGRRNQEN